MFSYMCMKKGSHNYVTLLTPIKCTTLRYQCLRKCNICRSLIIRIEHAGSCIDNGGHLKNVSLCLNSLFFINANNRSLESTHSNTRAIYMQCSSHRIICFRCYAGWHGSFVLWYPRYPSAGAGNTVRLSVAGGRENHLPMELTLPANNPFTAHNVSTG
jgi:hypothetical protein